MTVNWDHWGYLYFWPLDAACKIACGFDPDSPTFWSEVVCDYEYRPSWADMMIEAGGAIEREELNVLDRAWAVIPDDFRAWVASSQFKDRLHKLSRPKV